MTSVSSPAQPTEKANRAVKKKVSNFFIEMNELIMFIMKIVIFKQ